MTDDPYLLDLGDALQRLTAVLDNLRTGAEAANLLSYVREELPNIRASVAKLYQVLLEGNGQPALCTSIALLRLRMDKLEQQLSKDVQQEQQWAQTGRMNRAVLWAALITSVTSLAIGILQFAL